MFKHFMEGRVKKNKNSMKVENGSVHCKIYDGHCTKQQVRIPNAI